jgi:outer membrane protein assembly factor BamB
MSPDSRTIYIQGNNISLVAFELDTRQIKWTFGDRTLHSYPLVDFQGNIYILTNYSELNDAHSLYSLNPDGAVRWVFEHNNSFFARWESGMAMDKQGNIYFAYDTLYSVSYNGELNWKKPLDTFNLGNIVVDNIGNIYLQLTLDWDQIPVAYTQYGDVLWKLAQPIQGRTGRCGALGDSNRWYIATHEDEYIYCIK